MTTAVQETTEKRVISEATKAWLRSHGFGTLLDTLEMRGIVPTTEQWPILTCRKRTIQVLGGWRAGKSQVGTDYFWGRYDWFKAGLYWLIGSAYSQTESEYNFLADGAQHMNMLSGRRLPKFNRQGPSRFELKDGTVIETKSADNPRTIAGSACDGIIQCEAAQQEIDIFHRCRSRLVDKKGWHLLTGTLEGSLGYYPKLYELWRGGTADEQSFVLPSWSNVVVFPGGRQDPEILREEQTLPADLFLEKYAGIPTPPQGLVFKEFRADIHIRKTEYYPDLPLYMWVDPGYSDACSYEFFQEVNGQLQGKFEVYDRSKTAQDVIDILRTADPYRKIWAQATRDGGPGIFAVEDRYGDQHHHQSSVGETWLKETGIRLESNHVRSVNDVNDRIKSFLKFNPLTNEPGIVFDPSMKGILSEFGAYPNPFDGQTKVYRWKQDREGEMYGDVPEDKHNHGIKAIGYGIIDRFGYVTAVDKGEKIHVIHHSGSHRRRGHAIS